MIRRAIAALPQGFPAFLAVGGAGFVVDAAVLVMLVHLAGWGDYTARLASFAAAVSVTWLLNRTFAFAANRTDNRRREYTRYLAVQGIGMAINFAIYSLCIENSTLMDTYPVIALAIGSAVALVFNYLGARFFVFTGQAA